MSKAKPAGARPRRTTRPQHPVQVTFVHIPVPDAEDRLRRIYKTIFTAAERP